MKFRFKIQGYQTDAARAVTDVFAGQPNGGASAYLRDLGSAVTKGGMESLFYAHQQQEGYGNAELLLSRDELLRNVKGVQGQNRLARSERLAKGPGAVALDVEMETGTGKTYVYTKTMFELNRLYGWTKFIVVVPSIAIREGVFQSLRNTEQHFFEQYGKAIRYFVYDSSRLSELDGYSQSSDINVMIINMQAFNTSMKEDGRSKEARIMYSERDEFGSRRPIDVISANRPIVILDEPQKMGGKATKEGIRRFRPLFTLYYSATHKERHDLVYALDALDAFNQRLVKRIEVKGFELKGMRGTDGYLYLQDIRVYKDRPPVAVIEHNRLAASGSVSRRTSGFGEHDDVYLSSNELEAYRDGLTVAEVVPDQPGILGHVRFLNGLELRRGEVLGDSAEHDMRRVQIRETIKSHLEKEGALFARGIKCLSLFFIDKVEHYRRYDEEGKELLGEFGSIFEEEYRRAVDELLDGQLELNPAYRDYLRGIDASATHQGYFSIDKKGRSVDSKVKRGSSESDDQSAYDLILKDKARLLSFDEPTRFVFSHSALREGWDNPNVFQICTLKHSDSETGKRQEVGRGLRLCVNAEGERQDLETLGEEEVQQVNCLTVIASESYSSFVGALQSDVRQALRERPREVTEELFRGVTLLVDGAGEYTLTDADAREIVDALKMNRLVKGGQPTERFREEGLANIQDGDLSEHLDGMRRQIAAIVRSVEDPSALDGMVSNGLQTKVRSNPLNDNFARREFQELWRRINSKHSYTVSFDDEELREKSIRRIDDELVVSRTSYVVTTGGQRGRQTREGLDAREGFERTSHRSEELAREETEVTYDLLGEVASQARITRRSAAAILGGILPGKFAMFRDNPEEFIAKVARCILTEKAGMLVEHVEYHTLEERYESDIFAERMPENLSRALPVRHCVQDYLFWDSEGERRFASDLETAEGVVSVYAKLPRAFKIPTPVGDYAPDWAIAFKEGSVKHVYFVAETKGSMSTLDLRGIEHGKIDCARKLFEQLEDGEVVYGLVKGYDDLMKLVS